MRLGPVSRYLYRRNIYWKQRQYIREPQFLYVYPGFSRVQKIEDMELRVTSTDRMETGIRVLFTYRFPAQNLRFGKEKDAFEAAYRYRWVVYDEDYKVLASSDAAEEVRFSDRKELEKNDVSGQIEVVLIPGTYSLALRVEDLRSNRLGIYRKKFAVRSKGEKDSQAVNLLQD